jgi:RNA polymerase sigma factor (sigma-70 family)
MTADAACLRKYAEIRDEVAFTEFVRRNLDLVYSAALRQTGGDVQLAEDIAQKVFLSVARKARGLAGHPVISAWLYQATRYAAIDAMRSRRRQQWREMAFGEMNNSESAPDDPLPWEKVSPELDKIVSSLRDSDRAAVVLRFFGGKSFAEVGAQLNLSEGAARMRVERALEKLRVRLSRVGITSSSTALGMLLAEKGVTAAPAGLSLTVTAAAISLPVVGGITGALGIFQIMTSAKIALSVGTLVTLASITAAVFEFNHARSSDRALAEALRTRPTAPTLMAMEEPRRAPPAPSQNSSPSAAVVAAKPSPSPFSALAEMLNNPVFQRQTELSAKARLDLQYAALFKRLGLSPEQVTQFKDLLVEKEMVGFDSMSAAHQQGIDPGTDPQGFFRAVSTAEKTVDAQISALLGANNYEQFQHYQETVPARNTTNLLSMALSYSSTPLTPAQSEAVIQSLVKYGTPPLPPGNPFAVLNGDLGIVQLNPQGISALQGVLSPSQIDVLETKIQEQQQLLQARQHMGSR